MSTDDLRTLLDDLDAKHKAASPGAWRVALKAPCFLSVRSAGWDVAHTGDEMTRYSSEDAHAIASAHNALPGLIAATRAVLELHRPVEVEPSDTLCGECSFQLPNGRYFGKVVEWPCPTVAAIHAALIGDDDE